ncbi:transcription repressor OFP12-like [Quercus robur]|uniref:transcription repressor OFP12-like n=1 Tax=Quercus robur TaxID=38942 RepID=UPI00216266C5|nr:transcription repressor OFP12-like [Quercus robur]
MPMNSTPGKNLNLCFTKIKWPLAPQSSSSPRDDHDHHNHTFPSTSSSTLVKNFNSLYDTTTFDSTSKSLSHSSSSLSTNTNTSSSSEPDYAAAFASQRFFFSSPGLSNSIIQSTININADSKSPSPQQPHNNNNCTLVNNSVAVPTYSPDPYNDFRRSMQEMVEARELEDERVDVKSDWEFLHELLLCYLALNPKNTHKFIVGAFADLIVSLMSQQPINECEFSQR